MRWTASLTAVPVIVLSLFTMIGHAADQPGLTPKTVADYIHAVIEAHRVFYTIDIVERLQKQGGALAAENWRAQKNTLPLPVQFVTETSDMFSTNVTGVRYRLISQWPINPKNGPRGKLEENELRVVRERPEQPATSTIEVGGQTYFHAIYADVAVSPTCVGCHNTHPHSPKKDFVVGDVMGGLVIEFPLGKQ